MNVVFGAIQNRFGKALFEDIPLKDFGCDEMYLDAKSAFQYNENRTLDDLIERYVNCRPKKLVAICTDPQIYANASRAYFAENSAQIFADKRFLSKMAESINKWTARPTGIDLCVDSSKSEARSGLSRIFRHVESKCPGISAYKIVHYIVSSQHLEKRETICIITDDVAILGSLLLCMRKLFNADVQTIQKTIYLLLPIPPVRNLYNATRRALRVVDFWRVLCAEYAFTKAPVECACFALACETINSKGYRALESLFKKLFPGPDNVIDEIDEYGSFESSLSPLPDTPKEQPRFAPIQVTDADPSLSEERSEEQGEGRGFTSFGFDFDLWAHFLQIPRDAAEKTAALFTQWANAPLSADFIVVPTEFQ